ncbi:MAG: NADH-quinone oxidoreductase subunit NuoE [Methanomicrobia archaeon]|nr:NADH-quinone oxidoreductase subunit NuoE [Methanomicrobia archaeon]
MASDKRVDEIIDKYEGEEGFLIQLLLDIQREFNWIPKEAIERISTRLQIPLSHIYRIVSFYKVLSLKPVGRHVIQVCLGTACHVRGGPRILAEVENVLGIGAGTTTDDMKFTVNRVNCIGCCALGPVMIIDNDYHGKLKPTEVKDILARYD